MTRRIDSMATIDLALAGQLNAPAPAPEDTTQLDVVPGVAAPAPLTEKPKLSADEKRAFDATRQTELDRQKLLEQAMTAEKQERDAFDASAHATVSAAQRIVKGTGVRLGSIPTPGGITLPLVILLVFFFLLLPVNGHTRLTWLWLVLSGNAMISGGSLGTPGGAPAAPASRGDTVGGVAGPITVPGAAGPIFPLTSPSQTVINPPVISLPSFTGVEEL